MTAYIAAPLILLLLSACLASTAFPIFKRASRSSEGQNLRFALRQQRSPSPGPSETPSEDLTPMPSEDLTATPWADSTSEPSPSPSSAERGQLPEGSIPCSCEQGPRIRKEYGSLNRSEFAKFVNAFKALKDTDDGNSTFEQFVNIHRVHRPEAHGTSQFLPWHREYLFQIECRLRQIDPSVTIPYWDWSIDSSDPASSSLWGLIGGALPGVSIPNEPFENWSSSVPTQHNVIRAFNSSEPGSGFEWPLEDAQTIRNLQSDGSLSYNEFATSLEGYHGAPHVGVGGDMRRVDRSPNDISFFLHHAFVDKIWDEWQKSPRKRREYNGLHLRQPVNLSDTVAPWSGTIEDILARDECVTYEQPARSGVPSALRRDIRQRQRGRFTQKAATHQAGSDDDDGDDDDSRPIPTNLPKELAEKAKRSPVVQSALEDADDDEVEKLSKAKPGRLEAIATRINKNHGIDKWARIHGYPPERAKIAKEVAAKEDPSVYYDEVEDGEPPGE